MRKIVFKIFMFGCFAAALCLLYGFTIEPKMLKVRDVHISEPDWQGEPLRIALISDIHIGGIHMRAGRVTDIVETINEQSPDIILIAGDFISGHDKAVDRSDAFNTEIETGILSLSGLNAPLGVYASIGNHDDWYDGVAVKKYLRQANVTVLDNSAQSIVKGTSNFCLAGLPDSWTGTFNANVFDACSGENLIAFMHSPDSFKYLTAETTLALAGHTHGGQINLPFYGRRVTSTAIGPEFAYGNVNYKGIQTFITAGLGTSLLPARFRAPPEIAIINLTGE